MLQGGLIVGGDALVLVDLLLLLEGLVVLKRVFLVTGLVLRRNWRNFGKLSLSSLVVLRMVLRLVLVADSLVYGSIGHCPLRLLSNRRCQEVILLILLTLSHIRQQSCRIEERMRTRSIMAWLWWQLYGEVALTLCCKPMTCLLINWLQVFIDQIVITILLLRMLASETLLVQRIISKSWVWSSIAWPFHADVVSALPSAARINAFLQLLLSQFICVQINMWYCFTLALVLLLYSI